MEFTKETKQGKHHVVVTDREFKAEVTIVRLGRALKISYYIDKDIGFTKAMTKVNNVCNFDNEVFAMVGMLDVE